jgi:murein L,D-transpeptidase YafK
LGCGIADPLRSFILINRSMVRVLATSVALAAGSLLAGCNSDQVSLANNAKANKPISEKLVAEMQKKDMDPQSPMLIRLFKQEAELEVWKQDRSGKFALLQTYPICRWSGDLGPKIKEGDRQAPEGFYNITPAQMNPQSAYYLSFNMGYPNAFDKALGRTGSQLMVHGDCSSRGCYAMTDEQISDIYTLGRESFFGGQRAFQVQAYPFRMTPVNMAKHRNNPNMPFWKMIKVGYDHFEVTRHEPKVDFCEKKYVFDAVALPGSNQSPVFNAAATCPAYTIPADIADAVKQKEQADDAKVAELIAKGTPVARMNTGIDGGMNGVFAAKIPDGSTGLSDPVTPSVALATAKLPGTIPSHVNPPRPLEVQEPVVAVAPDSTPAAPTTRMAIAAPNAQSDNFFSSLARKVGLGGSDSAPTAATKPAPVAAKPNVVTATKKHEPHHARTAAAKPKATDHKTADHRVAGQKPPEPKVATAAPAKPAVVRPPAPVRDAMAGAAPVIPANSFDNRFSAMR